jgi:hypothetical protein
MPRDYNSSLNIKLRGLEMVGWGTSEPSFLDIEKLNTLAEIRTWHEKNGSSLNIGSHARNKFLVV